MVSFSPEEIGLADKSPCAGLRADLKQCLLDSDCCSKDKKTPRECLKDGNAPLECLQLRQSFFECKRSLAKFSLTGEVTAVYGTYYLTKNKIMFSNKITLGLVYVDVMPLNIVYLVQTVQLGTGLTQASFGKLCQLDNRRRFRGHKGY